jgi:hypothetical protein
MLKGFTLLAATEVGSRIRTKIAALGFYGAAGLVAFLGVVFLLVALLIWLSRTLSPLTASLIIAVGLFVIAGGLAIAARSQQPAKTATSPLSGAAMLAAPAALKIASRRVSFTTVAAVAAVALGALVGRRIARDG